MQESHQGIVSKVVANLSCRRKVFWYGSGIAALIVLFVACGLYATAAAHRYDTNSKTYETSLKKVAQASQRVDYVSVYWNPQESQSYGAPTPDSYAAAVQKCSDVAAAYAELGKLRQPTLASNVATVLGKPLSAAYRTGQHNQAATEQLTAAANRLRSHLARDTHNCQVFNRNLKTQLDDAANAAARQALLTPCGDANGCLEDPQISAYKNLYKSAVDEAQTAYNLYKNDCPYPELSAACRLLADYWKHSYQGNLAYYNALSPGGNFGTVTAADDAAAAQDAAKLCDTLQKNTQLYARAEAAGVSCDGTALNTFQTVTIMIRLLAQDDEAAIHTAAAAILKS